MQYYSLNHKASNVNFEEATLAGQAPDKGLYFPLSIPKFPNGFMEGISKYAKEEVGFVAMKPYIGGCIPDNKLQQIVEETVNFNFPLVKVNDTISSLELFHGPTLAFKDVGARFMSRCLGYFNRNANKSTTILVATSGDTGGAVANGFLGVEGVNVVILYPSGKVSPIQELQLTTLGQNIKAIEVNGTFDDCQAIVKQAFMDAELNKKLALTSANSINVARWLPQQMYYLFAYQQWKENTPPVISVPSGNFGNICAGIMAYASGMPVKYFIAASNANKTIPDYFKTGRYEARKAVATVSNAMDVGDPSNFVRVLEIFDNEFKELKGALKSISVNDAATVETIRKVYKDYNYTLDPHGAVAYHALDYYLKQDGGKGFFLETAHPVKFPDTVQEAIDKEIEIPESVRHLLKGKKQSIKTAPDFNLFKEHLMSFG